MKVIRLRIIPALLGLTLLISCAPPRPAWESGQPLTNQLTGTDDYPWWNDTVFYEIMVRSFYDSDGDGIGDINGLTEKLDYLNDGDPNTDTDLGITGIWLMPIHPSPTYHGYDVTNYYQINPDYGTIPDFQKFVDAAHERGIVVIIDMVYNHTSVEHPWFAQGQNPDSPTHDYYVWADARPDWGNWHTKNNGESYYYGLFWDGMPDLNYTNPAVTEEMNKVSEFWLDKIGIDGFRLDAVRHLIEVGSVTENTVPTHRWLETYREFYKGLNPTALTVGEIWDSSENVAKYVAGDELDLAFNFTLAEAYIDTAKIGKNSDMNFAFRNDITHYLPNQFATFLSNHDQNRVMSQLNENEDKAKIAAALLLTGPGVPFIYYGEELGMTGVKPDPELRLPMQWTSNANAGFTTGEPWRDPASNYVDVNLATQVDDENSLFNWYRQLVHLRNQNPALRVGDVQTLDSGNANVYAVVRESEDQIVVILMNLSNKQITEYDLSLIRGELPNGKYAVLTLFGEAELEHDTFRIRDNKFDGFIPVAELAPYQVLVFEIRK